MARIVKEGNEKTNGTPQWITYVTRQKDGSYNTYSEPYVAGAPEHDSMPNQNSFLALFKGVDFDETLKEADEFINQKQKEDIDNMTFEQIRKLNVAKPQESYVVLPGGRGYKVKTLDEMRREGLIK